MTYDMQPIRHTDIAVKEVFDSGAECTCPPVVFDTDTGAHWTVASDCRRHTRPT